MSKEALSQPEQRSVSEQLEPVAWMRQDGQRVTTASDRHNYPDYETRYSIPLYTTPPHSFFEDVANELRVEIAELQDHIRLLEKQLAQRTTAVGEDTKAWVNATTWRGLTDEDWTYLRTNCGSIRSAVETAEAKLREKNSL